MFPDSTKLPKPPLPYNKKGWRFTVRSHTPAPPTPVTRDCCRDFKEGRYERNTLSLIEWCLKYPPLPGVTLPGITEPSTVELKVLDPLEVGDGCNAQVFTVKILGSEQRLVAKTYDPLYLDDEEGYLSLLSCVDKTYTHEAHAYALLAGFQGKLVPRFFGFYSLDLPVKNGGIHRTVRLILIEYIQGTTMPKPIRATYHSMTAS